MCRHKACSVSVVRVHLSWVIGAARASSCFTGITWEASRAQFVTKRNNGELWELYLGVSSKNTPWFHYYTIHGLGKSFVILTRKIFAHVLPLEKLGFKTNIALFVISMSFYTCGIFLSRQYGTHVDKYERSRIFVELCSSRRWAGKRRLCRIYKVWPVINCHCNLLCIGWRDRLARPFGEIAVWRDLQQH